jgi:hypothetical protein
MRSRLVLLGASALLALAGCGGEGGSSDASSSSAGAQPTTTSTASRQEKPAGKPSGQSASTEPTPGPPASAFHPKPHNDSGGGSGQFVVKGADNSVQEYGSEADESELKAAARSLHGFLDARAERNWAAACTYLAESLTGSFEQVAETSSPLPHGCPATLAALSGQVPASNLHEAAVADVGSLRREADRAFLIYRAAHRVVCAISMVREEGAWKVASLSGVPLN